MKKLTLAAIISSALLGLNCHEPKEVPIPNLIQKDSESAFESLIKEDNPIKSKIEELETEFKISILDGGYLIRWQYDGTPHVYDVSKSANYESLLVGKLTDNPRGGGTPSKGSVIFIDFGRDRTVDAVGQYMAAAFRDNVNKKDFEIFDKIFADDKEFLKEAIGIAEKKWKLKYKD